MSLPISLRVSIFILSCCTYGALLLKKKTNYSVTYKIAKNRLITYQSANTDVYLPLPPASLPNPPKPRKKQGSNRESDPAKMGKEQRGDFTLEQIECISSVWANLRQSSADNGLYLLQHFYTLYPEEVQKFAFNLDDRKDVRPNFHRSQLVRDHSMKIMNAFDARRRKNKNVT